MECIHSSLKIFNDVVCIILWEPKQNGIMNATSNTTIQSFEMLYTVKNEQ